MYEPTGDSDSLGAVPLSFSAIRFQLASYSRRYESGSLTPVTVSAVASGSMSICALAPAAATLKLNTSMS